jgi:1,4-alpha-glucan branching enzyme
MALSQQSANSVQAAPANGSAAPDGTGVIQLDPWLEPFRDSLKSRFAKAQQWIRTIGETEGGLEKFSRGYEQFGFTFAEDGSIRYREWA